MKHIVRRIVVFRDGIVYMILQGYNVQDPYCLIHEKLPLGSYNDDNFDMLFKHYCDANYNVEVVG